ncbi:glucosaminidase domain-containing protein [Clostridium sp. SHJSY1]|uniref:glycoside hydrolase family 73 protein n=1 Tax=Clostridium sp. SHJSY1 TaxID=2942483 RepID=UPI002876DEF1|nr:glucosaminidase domain-containing protein [Clostridium sp. SHJSY1]MDS0525996.1 glucosaminidase domain-containing protein [Clostridium sp. SHJSY1]
MNEKFRRKLLRIVKTIFSLLVISCIGLTILYFYQKNDRIKLNNSEIKLYINSTDTISEDKLQVNWQYLAAIDYVRYKKDLSKSTDESIQELGKTFFKSNNSNNNFTLVSLDYILNELSFTKSQKEKTYKYIEQLTHIGLVPDNLKETSETKKFINELTPKAIEIYKKYKILPSITISQAVLESSWGKSELSTKANNLFGIKADNSWKGKSVNMTTSEYYNKTIKDNFRSYDNINESLDDYGKFISDNKRYKESGVFNYSQYIKQAQAIENAGYSTIEDEKGNNIYADLITNIIRENNLQLIDNKVQSEK